MGKQDKKKAHQKISMPMQKYRRLEKELNRLGFIFYTDLMKARDRQLFEITPPDNKRGADTKHSVSFKKDDSGLTMWVHIPIDLLKKRFNETGMLWIVVANSLPIISPETYYSEPIVCNDDVDFIQNAIWHIRAVEWRIRHRPVSTKTRQPQLMVPYRDRDGEFYFIVRRPNGRIAEKKKMFIGLMDDPAVVAYINKWQKTKKAIFKRRKKQKNRPMNRIRKPHVLEKVTKRVKGIKGFTGTLKPRFKNPEQDM